MSNDTKDHAAIAAITWAERTAQPAKQGDLRVWWIPQVPMQAFYVPVADLAQATLILDMLAQYDLFQFKHRVKPDYSNAGGLQMFDESGEWTDWYDEDSGESFDEYRERLADDLAESDFLDSVDEASNDQND
jgi:hypothetical protein